MSYNVETRNQLVLLRQKELRIQGEKEKLSEELQRTCTHDVIVECLILPLRLCRHCKLEESGWKGGAGYKRLAGEHVPKVTYREYCELKDEEFRIMLLPQAKVHS